MDNKPVKVKNSKIMNKLFKITYFGMKFEKQPEIKGIVQKEAFNRLLSIDDTRTPDEIKNIISQINIETFKYRKPRFSGIQGMAHPWFNTIYINSDFLDIDKNQLPMKAVVHELIHKLQQTNNYYQGKEISGLTEGATESYALKAMDQNVSTVLSQNPKTRVNCENTAYLYNVLVFNQMETILGNDSMKRFALRGDTDGIEEFQNLYGKDLYEKIRKFSNKTAANKFKSFEEPIEEFKALQDEMLFTCYDDKFFKVSDAEQAKQYLEELKKLENDRIHQEGDSTFKNYYNSKYMQIASRFPREDIKQMEYKDFKFNPLCTEKQKEETRKTLVSSLANRNINYEDLQRFSFEKDDTVFDIVTLKGKPVSCVCLSDDDKSPIYSIMQDKQNPSMYTHHSGIEIQNQDGKLVASTVKRHSNIGGILLDNEELHENSLGISREEWNEEIKSRENEARKVEEMYQNSGIRGAMRRITSIFKKPKALPAGKANEINQKPQIESQQTEQTKKFKNDLKVEHTNVRPIKVNSMDERDNSKDKGKSDEGMEL